MTVHDEKGTGKPGMPRDTASCETCHVPHIARGGGATQVD